MKKARVWPSSHAALVGAVAGLLFACAGDKGTEPRDASAAEHAAMAEREEQAAAAHEEAERQAATAHASRSDTTNERDAERHRELAAEHRAASSALVEAEQRACAGLSPDERDISPFYHREDITSVSVLEEPVRLGRQAGKRKAGARIVFRAEPGMTVEWLQRVVDCHLARNAALGHDVPEMAYCPLVPEGVKARVHPMGGGFAVDVTSDDASTVKEIIRRAEMLR